MGTTAQLGDTDRQTARGALTEATLSLVRRRFLLLFGDPLALRRDRPALRCRLR
jgi:hypothetical protein